MILLKFICLLFVGIFAVLLLLMSFVFSIVAVPITWLLLLIERVLDYVKNLLNRLN